MTTKTFILSLLSLGVASATYGAVCCPMPSATGPKDGSHQKKAAATLIGSDVVDTAVEAGQFKTLAAALSAAGLVDTLKTTQGITVFAPTDEAFAALPEGVLEMLLKPENKDTLVSILQYHVLGSPVMASEVTSGEVTTLSGQNAVVSASANGVQIGGANVIATDILATNGIIHVIDAVLLPPGLAL